MTAYCCRNVWSQDEKTRYRVYMCRLLLLFYYYLLLLLCSLRRISRLYNEVVTMESEKEWNLTFIPHGFSVPS